MQQENNQLREENFRLKSVFEMQRSELYNMKHEKECLDNTVEESNISAKALNTLIANLHSQLNVAEKEHEKCCVDKVDINEKAKEAKKIHLNEIVELKAQIEVLSKNLRVKDKTIHDLSKTLNNARDTIKNLKSEK